jgi:hypothetical protein
LGGRSKKKTPLIIVNGVRGVGEVNGALAPIADQTVVVRIVECSFADLAVVNFLSDFLARRLVGAACAGEAMFLLSGKGIVFFHFSTHFNVGTAIKMMPVIVGNI